LIKRTSLVWKRPGLSDLAFRTLWLGEHAELAKRLEGVRQYVVDFIPDAPVDLPSGIAVLRFDSHADLDRAFADEDLRGRLMETRAAFAARVEVFVVDECVVVGLEGAGA